MTLIVAQTGLTGTPVLRTPRLILRAPVAADWPVFRDFAMSDRTAFVGGAKPEAEAAQKFAAFFGHWVMRGFGRLIAERADAPGPIGHFGPMQWLHADEVELTWSLWTPAAEGRGYATEAARAMQDWAFGELGIRTARAEVHRDNHASHAIARRLGGQIRPDRAPAWFADGAVYGFAHQEGIR
jgi:[ribosomal protein S5]-alanine N-acetyltransferase